MEGQSHYLNKIPNFHHFKKGHRPSFHKKILQKSREEVQILSPYQSILILQNQIFIWVLILLYLLFGCSWSRLTLHNFENYFVWTLRKFLFYVMKCVFISWLVNQFLCVSTVSTIIPVILSAIFIRELIRLICL